MEYEPQEGVDYIIDLYAVVGVERDAPEPEIKQGIRERMREYHPDRLEGLAPEFQDKGEDMARILNHANAILLDAEKRSEYDGILDEWTGPVSEDGNPIILIDRALQAEFHDKSPKEVEKLFAGQVEKISAVLGYSPQRLEFLCKLIDQVKGEVPDDLKAEYEAALLQRDQVLAVEESERAKLLGLPSVVSRQYATTRNYAALVEGSIQETRSSREEEAKRLAISGPAGRLALLAGEDTSADDNLPATAAQLAALPAYFEDQAAKVVEIAKEREELLEARLGNFSLTYPLAEAQTEFTKKLALGMEGTDGLTWICVEVGDDDTGAGSTLPDSIEELLTQEDFEPVIGQGYNIATCELLDQVDIPDLVRVAAGKYVDNFPQPTTAS